MKLNSRSSAGMDRRAFIGGGLSAALLAGCLSARGVKGVTPKPTRRTIAVGAFCTVPPGSDSEEHFRKDYGGRYFRDQVRRNFRKFNAALEKWIAARNDSRVVLVRWDGAIDTATGYANAVHPNLKGGEQLGDALFDWLVGDLETRWGGANKVTLKGDR